MRTLLMVAAVVASGEYAFAASGLSRGLVGFTSGTLSGDIGVLAMTKLCQADFPASRMCSSAEVLATQTIPSLPKGPGGWVQPSLVPNGMGGLDVSGTASASPWDLSCSGWSQASGTGLVVDGSGRFTRESCSATRHVACCAGQSESATSTATEVSTSPTSR